MPDRGKQFSESPDEYRTLGDEPEKEPKWEREHPDLYVHLPRRYQLATTQSLEDYYGTDYQYGKRPRNKK